MDAEAGVGPGEHAGGGIRVEPFRLDEPRQHGALPGGLEHGEIMSGSGAERAVGHEHVEVGVPVGERAEALDADDDAGLTEGGALICKQGAVGELAQGAETAAIVEEERAQPFGNRDCTPTRAGRRSRHYCLPAPARRDAKQARGFGAEGIGLCRTEHMFFAEDRLAWVVQMIMSAPEVKMLREKLERLEADVEGLGPVSAREPKREIAALKQRLAGPPLHEFLPRREDLMVDIVRLSRATLKQKREMASKYLLTLAKLKQGMPQILQRVEELHEFNPMLGHRGCRLGITYPKGRHLRRARW